MPNCAVKAILERRSVRKYLDKPVPGDLRDALLKAAMSAPSACNQQPWHFVIIEDRDILVELSGIHGGYLPLKNAPLAILVCGEPKKTVLEYYWEYDCCAAVENMLISAHSLGLGAVWMGINQKDDKDANIIRSILNIPARLAPFALVSAGYPAEAAAPAQRFDERKIHYGRFA